MVRIDLLRAEVRAQAVRAQLLRAALEAGIGELQKAVGVLEGGLEAAGGLSAKGEVGQRHPPLDAGPLRLVPAPPNLDVQAPAAR